MQAKIYANELLKLNAIKCNSVSLEAEWLDVCCSATYALVGYCIASTSFLQFQVRFFTVCIRFTCVL